MKKTLIFALVLGLAVAFAVPAFAFKIEGGKDTTFYFGALVLTDFGVWNRSKELVPGYSALNPGKTSDRTELILDLSKNSRIRGNLEVGQVGAYWELRLGGDNQLGNAGAGGWSSSGYLFAESGKLYGYYKFGNSTLLAGKTDGHIYSVVPYQNLGKNNNDHNSGYGWGAINDQKSTQVRFSQDISKAFGYDFSLVQPQYYNDNGLGTVATGTAGAQQSLGVFPLAALKLRMKFGAVSLLPAAYVQYVKWNDLPQVGGKSPDDNMTSWAAVLPIVVKAGAFTGTFQGMYGQNTSSAISTSGGPLSGQKTYWGYRRSPNGNIKNSTGWAGFADLAFTSGPVTPHFYLGFDYVENDVFVGSDKNNMRSMYGVGVNWKIAESFYVVPEFSYYNYGKNPLAVKNPDLGTEWQAGVQFQFVF
jgi:hypothetical protein